MAASACAILSQCRPATRILVAARGAIETQLMICPLRFLTLDTMRLSTQSRSVGTGTGELSTRL